MAEDTIHIILGNDEGKVQEAKAAVLNSLESRLDPDFGMEAIKGRAANIEEAQTIVRRCLESLQTPPFFGEKLVHLQDTNLFSNNQTAGAEDTIEAVANLLDFVEQGLPHNIHFLVTGDKVDGVRRNGKRVVKIGRFVKCEKINTSKPGWEREVAQHILTRARGVGATFSRDALELFTLLIGAETKLIDNEIEKLLLYCEPGKDIDIDAVRLLTPLSEAGYIFEIGESIASRNGAKVLDLIDRQLEVGGKKGAGESAIALIRAAIIPTLRHLLHARILIEKHGLNPRNGKAFSQAVQALPESETAFLSRTKKGAINIYGLSLTAAKAQAFSLDGLKQAFADCLEADRNLVTTALDHRLILHRLVGRILAAAA